MAETSLVGLDIEGGRDLLELLDEAGIPVAAALWQYRPATEDWNLDIVTPLVEQVGVKGAFAKLDAALSSASSPPMENLLHVSVFAPESWMAKSLRRGLRGTRERYIKKQPVADHIVEDGYIYFVK